jgi:streptogramin lyase
LCTTTPDNIAGNASQTGNPQVVGVIVNGSGNPVKGATVRLVPASFNPQMLPKRLAKKPYLTTGQIQSALLAAVDSTVTDSNGQYSFDTVDTGTYNVLADSGTAMAYEDSVTVEPDTQTTVPTDTLKASGSVRGVLRLHPGPDSRTVFLIALGTFAVTAPSDSTGNFAMANMAEGTYSIRILSTLDDYGVLDTTFAVTAGVDRVLEDTIALPYTGIPVPKGLTIAYDTLKQIVTLTWNAPTAGRAVKGYNVYRKHQDSTSFEKIAGVVTDTKFVDSTATEGQTYEYKVAAVDTNEEEGTRSGTASLEVVSAYEMILQFGTQGTGPVDFDEPVSVSVDANGAIFIGDFQNDRVQKLSPSGAFISELTHSSFNWISGIKIKDDKVYVVEQFSEGVAIFDTAGVYLKTIATSIGLYHPCGIDVDARGNVYIVDGSKVFKVDTTDALLDSLVLEGYLHGPTNHGIAIDSSGRIWVASSSNIQAFDSSGSPLSTLPIVDSRLLNFEFDESNNILMIAASTGTIRKYSQAGTLLEVFGKLTPYTDDKTGVRPVYDIAVAPNGDVVLTSYNENRVTVFRKK